MDEEREPGWFRLKAGWYQDEVLNAIADSGVPEAVWAWPMILSRAKNASSTKNPHGVFKTTVQQLARDFHIDVDRMATALEYLEEGELVSVDRSSQIGILQVTVEAFKKWQTPRGSKRERDERYRFRLQAKRSEKRRMSVAETSPARLRYTGDRETVDNIHNAVRDVTSVATTKLRPTDAELVADKIIESVADTDRDALLARIHQAANRLTSPIPVDGWVAAVEYAKQQLDNGFAPSDPVGFVLKSAKERRTPATVKAAKVKGRHDVGSKYDSL